MCYNVINEGKENPKTRKDNNMMETSNPQYLLIAAEFMSECVRLAVPIPEVAPMFDGFRFSFRDDNGKEIGDGIIHCGSYRHNSCIETMGMPWDDDDVSTHTPQELAILLQKFYYGTEDYDCDFAPYGKLER